MHTVDKIFGIIFLKWACNKDPKVGLNIQIQQIRDLTGP